MSLLDILSPLELSKNFHVILYSLVTVPWRWQLSVAVSIWTLKTFVSLSSLLYSSVYEFGQYYCCCFSRSYENFSSSRQEEGFDDNLG